MRINKFKLLAFVALLLLVSGCTSTPINNAEIQTKQTDSEAYAKAKAFFNKTEYTSALEQFRLAIEQDPSLTDAYLQAAKILSARGRYEAANQILASSDGNIDVNANILLAIADNYYRMDNLDSAEANYKRALTLEPSNKKAIAGMFNVLSLQDKNQLSQEFARGIDNDLLDDKLKIAKAVILLDDISAANTLFEQVKSGQDTVLKDAAAKLKDDAAKLGGNDSLLAKANMCYLLLQINLYEIALPLTNQIITSNKYYENGYIYRGAIYDYLNYPQKAEADYAQAVALNPKVLESQILLTKVQLSWAKYDAAKATFNKLKDPLIKTPDNHALVNQLLNVLNRYERDTLINDLYSALGGEKAEFTKSEKIILTGSLLRQSRTSAAQKIIETVGVDLADLDSNLKANYYSYSAYLAAIGNDTDKSADLFNTALQINPLSSEIYFYRGLALQRNNQLEAARISFARAIDLDFTGQIALRLDNIIINQ